MRLADAGLAIRDVDLGGIDAESDHKLDEYFVTTPYVESALRGRRALFLGRKGSGKSALFRQLPRLLREHDGTSVSPLLLTPDQYAWSALKSYREQGLLQEQAHTNAWKLTLAIELASHLTTLDRDWVGAAEQAIITLRKFLSANYGANKPTLSKTASSLLRGVTHFNLSAFGFGVGAERLLPEQTLTPAVADALFDQLDTITRDQPVLVAFDRLDDSWDGSPESASLIIGLLKAAKDLNDSSRFSHERTGTRVLIFLRSDIYDALRFDDKDKHRATEEHIAWTADQLKEMLGRRLPSGIAVDELFEPGDMRGSISPFNYILKRTFLRPREVLQFMDEALRKAGSGAVEVRKDDIRAAEERYSSWKVDDLKQEYAKVFPDFDMLLECLRQEIHRYDSLSMLENVLRQKAPQLVEAHGLRSLLETLFDSSVIGVRLGDAGSARFKSEDADLALPVAGAVYVHQSLYRGLKIREARRPADESDEVRRRRDTLTIQLMKMMMADESIRTLAFMGANPTPGAVLSYSTFLECATELGVLLDIYESDSVAMSANGQLSRPHFEMDSESYRSLREKMLAVVTAEGLTPEEFRHTQ